MADLEGYSSKEVTVKVDRANWNWAVVSRSQTAWLGWQGRDCWSQGEVGWKVARLAKWGLSELSRGGNKPLPERSKGSLVLSSQSWDQEGRPCSWAGRGETAQIFLIVAGEQHLQYPPIPDCPPYD